MHKLFSIPAAAIVAVIFAFITSPTPAHAADMTLYKTPGCQCCEGYADYLREKGFTVYVKPTHDLVSMSRAAGTTASAGPVKPSSSRSDIPESVSHLARESSPAVAI